LPSLRERACDIPEIATHFLDRQRDELGRKTLTPAAMSRLMSERWPGNVRQLRNVVVRAAACGSGVEVGLTEIVHALRAPSSTPPPPASKSRIVASVRDRSEATALVEAHGGSIAAAARTCGVPRETMRDWVKGATRKPRALSAVAT
jgi:DNA-binding NtrC family response regulator